MCVQCWGSAATCNIPNKVSCVKLHRIAIKSLITVLQCTRRGLLIEFYFPFFSLLIFSFPTHYCLPFKESGVFVVDAIEKLYIFINHVFWSIRTNRYDERQMRRKKSSMKDFNLKSKASKGRGNRERKHQIVEAKIFSQFVYDFVKVQLIQAMQFQAHKVNFIAGFIISVIYVLFVRKRCTK